MTRPSTLFTTLLLMLGLVSVNCQAAPTSGASSFRIAAGSEASKGSRSEVHRSKAPSAKSAPAGKTPAKATSRRGSSQVTRKADRRLAARANPERSPARVNRGVNPTAARILPLAAVAAGTTIDPDEVSALAATMSPSIAPAVSVGSALGLHRVADPLALRSGTALVIDQETGEVLFEKNPQYVLPIASLTKLMTAMVVLDARQPLDEMIEVIADDRDTDRFSTSHLPVGARLARRELLQLALMASENRAAAALARTYPGGFDAYVEAANRKAKALGMVDTTFADGTGLSASNVSTAHDLARMAAAASRNPMIAEMSLASSLSVRLPGGSRNFHTTNRLVGSPNWELELQKTGYITEAGNCLLLQARVDDRRLIVVLLDSFGRYSRIGDAERIRRWLENPA